MVANSSNTAQSAIQWVSAALSSEVKRPKHGTDHSFPSVAEIKKMFLRTSFRDALLSTRTLIHRYIAYDPDRERLRLLLEVLD